MVEDLNSLAEGQAGSLLMFLLIGSPVVHSCEVAILPYMVCNTHQSHNILQM